MRKRRARMTVQELRSLYPDIKLMEGYDKAFVGVVPAPSGGCIAVYDSTKIISILSDAGFTTQEELVNHFEKVVASAQIKDGGGKIGPLFMQSVSLIEESSVHEITEADLEEHRARIERNKEDDSEDGWHVDYDLEGEKGEEGPQGISDSDSDSEHYDIGDITFEGSDDEDEDEDDYEDDDEDPDLAESGYDSEPEHPYMEIVVEIGRNSPDDCMITRSVRKIKEAMRLIFPNLPRLDMISKASFTLRELSDLEDEEGDDNGDDEGDYPYMPPGSL